ncbi:MAG: hypothetical protein D3923_10935, partial [Candidatus Electrothrix sp. AR3]|nr:hypothetical protein [Candidatus Electrothrix sp. AR3]
KINSSKLVGQIVDQLLDRHAGLDRTSKIIYRYLGMAVMERIGMQTAEIKRGNGLFVHETK